MKGLEEEVLNMPDKHNKVQQQARQVIISELGPICFVTLLHSLQDHPFLHTG
jgi:hypothetical protein